MKALFIGNFNHYTIHFAGKLAKNGVDVAIFNNTEDPGKLGFKYGKYTSEVSYVSKVYANFRPDTIIVTSAFDGPGYLDGLEHILNQAAGFGVRHVIFLSSVVGYGSSGTADHLPDETLPLKPRSQNSLLFAGGEDICKRWREASGIKTTIIRSGGIYGEQLETADFNRLIREAAEGREFHISDQDAFSFLHIDDMAEAFMLIFENAFSDVYNICSSEIIPARQFCGMVNEAIGGPPRVLLSEEAATECHAADTSLFKSEYKWWERHRFGDEYGKIIGQEKELQPSGSSGEERRGDKKKAREDHSSRLSNLWHYVETILLFIVLLFFIRMQKSVDIIAEIDFIILYLILVAVVMTLWQSALSLLLAVGLIVWQRVDEGYGLFTAIINNKTLLLAAQYCIASVAVSYVLQRLKIANMLLKLELGEQKTEMEMLEQFSEDNLRSRHFFEDRIIAYDLSLPRVISMTSRLDVLEPERILPETIKVISECIGIEDVATYFIGEKGGRMRLSYAKTPTAAILGQSPVLEDYRHIIDTLENDDIYINTGMDEKDPSMAAGVKIGGRLAFIFVAVNVPFHKMCLDTSNLFQSVTTLVSAALRRANQYEELMNEQRYLPGTTILRFEAFQNLCTARLSDEGMAGGILCEVMTKQQDFRQTGEILEALTRENDYLGTDEKGRLFVLLSGTTLAGYQVFEQRLLEKGLQSIRLEEGIDAGTDINHSADS